MLANTFAGYLLVAAFVSIGCTGPAEPPSRSPSSPAPRADATLTPSVEPTNAPSIPTAALGAIQESEPLPALADASIPPLYASLFEKGRTFTYRVETESSHYDPDDKKANKSGTVEEKGHSSVKCSTVEVRELPGARLAKLDCGNEGNESFAMGLGEVTPAGLYVATEAGLFKLPFDAEVPRTLEAAKLIMAREPQPAKVQSKSADGESSHEVKRDADGAWCSHDDEMMGDASFRVFCFQPKKGLVRTEGGWDGGSSHSASFTLVK